MNKADIISSSAERSGLTKNDQKKAVKAFLEEIGDALERGEKVNLIGFGTFENKERKARVGRNPRTREEIQIPASNSAVFKQSKPMKEKLNKQK
jgi:DNA-binding protein HU-beta